MSDTERQQAKNSIDIAHLKLSFPIILFFSIIASVSLTIWGGATWVADFKNGNINFKQDQERQNKDLKTFFMTQLHEVRVKDSTDIVNVYTSIINLENIHYQDVNYKIGLLNEKCKRWGATAERGVTEQKVNGELIYHPYSNNKK